MKIASLNPYNLTFKSNNCDDYLSMGDDLYGAKLRSVLRNHIYPQLLFEEENTMPDYAHSIEDVYIPNMENIGSGSYRGASLFRNSKCLDLLVNSDISTVIDLAGFDKLKHACEDKNLKYYRYYVPLDYWMNPIFADDKDLLDKKESELYTKSLNKKEFLSRLENYKFDVTSKRKLFIDEFADFVDVVNSGPFYIGCDLGEFRTPNVLALNSYFNPKWNGDKMEPTTEFVRECIKNMYKNLTDEDKKRLGIDSDYDKKLREKLGVKKGGN